MGEATPTAAIAAVVFRKSRRGSTAGRSETALFVFLVINYLSSKVVIRLTILQTKTHFR